MLSQCEKIWLLALPLWLLLTIPKGLDAQGSWNIQRFGLADGLPDRSVIRIAQDSFGFRWLATETGLFRFDGHRFDRPSFTNQLLTQSEFVIREMTIDQLGRVICWSGGSDFLQWINSRTNEVARLDKPASNSPDAKHLHFLLQYPQPVSALQQAGEYFKLFQLDQKGEWQEVFKSDQLSPPNETVKYLGQSPTKEYYFYQPALQKILVFAQDQLIRKIELPGTEKAPSLIQLDRQGRLWYQADNDHQLQLYSDTLQQFKPYLPLVRRDDIRYNKFYEDDFGHLIFGAIGPTSTTALVLLGLDGQVEDLQHILRKERKITGIFGQDFYLGFDLSTYGGYYRISRSIDRLNAVNYLNSPDEVNRSSYLGRIMRGFVEGADGTIYGNTEGGMWLSLSPPNYQLDTFYPTINGIDYPPNMLGSGHNLVESGNYIYGLFASRINGNYQAYLSRFEPKTKSWKEYPIPLEGSFGRFVLALPDGDLLVFLFRRQDRLSKIYRFNPKEEKFWLFGDFSTDLPVRSRSSAKNVIYDKARNKVWLATGNGLFAYQPCFSNQPCYFDSTKSIHYPEVNLQIQSLLLLEDGKLLLATLGEGIQVFDPENRSLTILAYDPSQLQNQGSYIDLPSNLVSEMVLLDSQNLAISTYNGMVVADLKSRRSINYTTVDGLPNNEFNRLSILLSTQDELFIGGINGFSRISTDVLLPKPTGPSPRLSSYYSFDEKERKANSFYRQPNDKSEIIIPPHQAYLGFNFTAAQAENMTYRSWLKGYEIDYGLASTSGQVEYLRVPAGSYTLYVEATNPQGESSAVPLEIPIRVQQPWYLRPWFLVLSQLLLIGGGVLVYRNRVQRIKEQEAEKTRVSRQLADLEMKILRQQLNPHFIFNALGAIQHFIQGMRGPDAMEYLADFAKLMRMFLESSKQSYIFLVDELKLIKLYVRLEQLRFNNKFDAVYDIDPDLDLDMEDIPSLLLQPFVENAINHGIFHLNRRGTLTIGMRMDEAERIVITIADDGIGRKAAAELRAKTYKKHKSRATQIVEERLEIFQRSAETDVQITTEDLHPNQAETGTKVTITVEGS